MLEQRETPGGVGSGVKLRRVRSGRRWGGLGAEDMITFPGRCAVVGGWEEVELRQTPQIWLRVCKF